MSTNYYRDGQKITGREVIDISRATARVTYDFRLETLGNNIPSADTIKAHLEQRWKVVRCTKLIEDIHITTPRQDAGIHKIEDLANISVDVLKKLPAGKIVRIEKIKDMDENDCTAIVVRWIDHGMMRLSHFDVENGDYLGEAN